MLSGSDTWNQWRKENPEVSIDFSGANLSGVDLNKANLSFANLIGADLNFAILFWADLCEADLSGADLRRADLRIRIGKPGQPRKRLPKGVRVRLKNKGSKKRRGRPREKYQAPVPEHPQTDHEVLEKTIHANHVEAFNASIRRRNTAFCRKTNTYAKSRKHLQRTLDVYWLVHNFVRIHFTTKVVPAVKLGILKLGISWSQLLSIRYAV